MRIIFLAILLLASTILGSSIVEATFLYKLDNENFTINQQPPTTPYHFDSVPCTQGCTARIRTAPATEPFLGTKYFEMYFPALAPSTTWLLQQNQDGNYGTPAWSESNPVPLSTSTMYYMAVLVNMDRMGNGDIWRGAYSANKGIDLHGPSNVVRAGIGFGWWNWQNPASNKYTIILKANGHSDFDNDNAGCYGDNNYCYNQNGYTRSNNYYMDYERWYSIVFGIQPGANNTGKVRWWINGTLVASYDNVTTTGANPTLNYIENFATLCQNAYDCPEHKENFDQLVFVDNVNDINQNGEFNFFADPESGSTPTPTPDTQAPTPPGSLSAAVISPTQVNLSWSAATDNVGVMGYRLERCTGTNCTTFTQISTPTGTSFNNTTLTAGTTYQYRVRAIDAAGNLSLYSTTVSATTPSAPTPTPTPPPGSVTVTLAPSGDTTLGLDTNNYSVSDILQVYTWPANSVANAILMKFSLSSIPVGSIVSSALLNLVYLRSEVEDTDPQSTAYSVSAHKVINRNSNPSLATGATYDGTNPWTANTCCNGGIPMAQADISSPYDTEGVTKAPNVLYSWNITSMVQDWLNTPSANFGLLLNADLTKTADRSRYFASQEHGTASSRPSLTVTYTTPSGGDAVAPGVPTGVRVE